jgi:hypothetical protein
MVGTLKVLNLSLEDAELLKRDYIEHFLVERGLWTLLVFLDYFQFFPFL